MKSALRNEGQRLNDDLRGMGEHMGQVKEDLVGLGRDLAGTAKSGVAAAKETVSRTVEKAKERGGEAVDALSEQITKRPFTSVGIAVGVGVLIGMFVFRPRS